MAPNYALAAIAIGGGVAHTCCILLAQLLGKVIEKCCKEYVINIIGGVFFLLFGIYELLFNIAFTHLICVEFLGSDCDEELGVSFSSRPQ